MKIQLVSLAAFFCSVGVATASTTALDVALPYNYFVLGNFSAAPDITGRVAIGGSLTSSGLTVGSDLPNSSDPYSLTAAPISLYAGIITGGGSDNINKGNVYVAGSNNANFNFNGGGSKVASCGGNCIDFISAATTLKSYSTQLSGLAQNGTIGPDSNPSNTLLKGTNSTLNVFNLTAAQFNNATLDIVTPANSTTVVNVSGNGISATGGGLYINGNQASGTQSAGAKILFNFASTQTWALTCNSRPAFWHRMPITTVQAKWTGT